jgi:hypothetical protein
LEDWWWKEGKKKAGPLRLRSGQAFDALLVHRMNSSMEVWAEKAAKEAEASGFVANTPAGAEAHTILTDFAA